LIPMGIEREGQSKHRFSESHCHLEVVLKLKFEMFLKKEVVIIS
jgi:hypothetical protein